MGLTAPINTKDKAIQKQWVRGYGVGFRRNRSLCWNCFVCRYGDALSECRSSSEKDLWYCTSIALGCHINYNETQFVQKSIDVLSA